MAAKARMHVTAASFTSNGNPPETMPVSGNARKPNQIVPINQP